MSVDMKNVKYIWANKYDKAILLNSSATVRTISYVTLRSYERNFLDENYPEWQNEIIVIARAHGPTLSISGAAMQLEYYDYNTSTQITTSGQITSSWYGQLGDAIDDTGQYTYTRIWRIRADARYQGYNRIRLKYTYSGDTGTNLTWSNYVDTYHFVNKIEDSNGNVIWGSTSAFLYRRLEYIKFSGAEYVNTWLSVPGNTSYKKLDIKANFQNTSNWGINGFDSSTNNRFNIGVGGNGYTRIGVGSIATWADSDGVLLALNTTYTLSLLVNGTATSNVYNEQGSLIGTGATTYPSFSSGSGVLYIGAANSNNSAVAFCEEKIYNVKLAITNSSNITSNLIPCQRKSDNICGFYDTVRNAFYPMQGTNITANAAGPVADEYWDLTAPQ